MRLLTFRTGSSTKAARIEGDVAVELPYSDVGAILVAGATEAVRQSSGPEHRLADLQLEQPVLVPPKILCVGQNYRAHIEEQHGQVPQFPTLFNKWHRTLIGPRDEVRLPAISQQTDWEVELAFYIGATLRHGDEQQAQRSIAGYTIVNDVSVRDWQHHTTQFLPGKNFESLEPGDLIATGTPAGVGAFRKPPIYLRDGQVITSEIDSIGCLVNRCVQEAGSL